MSLLIETKIGQVSMSCVRSGIPEKSFIKKIFLFFIFDFAKMRTGFVRENLISLTNPSVFRRASYFGGNAL